MRKASRLIGYARDAFGKRLSVVYMVYMYPTSSLGRVYMFSVRLNMNIIIW